MTKSFGYLFVDHRASPGIPEDQARRMGLPDPKAYGEGKLFEADTLTCSHCGTIVVMNPGRTRVRAHCHQCNSYICDMCEGARLAPDYVHTTVAQIKDMVGSGSYNLSGSFSNPTLTKATGGK